MGKKGKTARGFRCSDCGFVAAHAMGLGRHRAARHGAVSKRAQMGRSTGGWLTRREAARRANVHYNTVRQWEHAGLVRKTKRPGVRGVLISASDLARLVAERSSASGFIIPVGTDIMAIGPLDQRYLQLIAGLEQLLASARASAPKGAKHAGHSNGKAAKRTTARGGHRGKRR